MPKNEETKQIGENAGYIILAVEIVFYSLLAERKGIQEWETKRKYCFEPCGFLESNSRSKLKKEYPDIFNEAMEIVTLNYLVDPAAYDFRNAARELSNVLVQSGSVKRKSRRAYSAGHML